ncbi:hypothetical protein [Paenibacillus glycanilyticus]|uniref:hypothetical protein n=1 Tax=Paenibacillus glycanilyticus TaxID=126569 RepID=UPI00190FCE66|nr:hypothetical protein [Paenibacillus glycanilyticus]
MKFIQTSRPNQIFYGDLFKINQQGCLVFGFGKTKACRVAGEDFGLDFACLTRMENVLYGHCEHEIRAETVPDPIDEREKLDYLIRMLDAEETNRYASVLNGQILSIKYHDFVKASQFNITFTVGSGFQNHSSEQRVQSFVTLTEGADIKEFLLVPWMDSHSDKGNLLKNYIR